MIALYHSGIKNIFDNMSEDEFFTIEQGGTAEIKIKGSRFIGTAQPVATEGEAMAFIHHISKKFHDATHNCYAYLIGYHSASSARSSDAGEPSGTAGLPILTVIKGKKLTDIVVVVTRYFGGTKLGTGGLARAYSECARQVIDRCLIIKKYLYDRIQLEFEYHLFGSVMRIVSLYDAKILESIYDQNTKLMVSVRKSLVEPFKSNLIEVTSARIMIRAID
jgi:uncharacterized YigZ family protein